VETINGKPTAAVFDDAALATYLDLTITPGTGKHTLAMKTKPAFKDMLDIGGLGDPAIAPKFKVTCDGVPTPSSSDPSLTIQIVDQNNKVPTFNKPNSTVINVDIDDWVAATAINKEIFKVVDLDHTKTNALLTVTSNGTSVVKHTNTTIAEEGGIWVTSVLLYLNESVAYGTHSVKLTAKDSNTAHAPAELTLSIQVSGASQIGSLLMVTLASLIGTWFML